MKTVSIVIPCYNEEKTIKEVISRVKAARLPSGWEKEIIVVDDGSTDGTRRILEEYQSVHTLIFKEKNEGKGSALKAGFKKAKGDYILIQDADLEYNPDEYAELLAPIVNNSADMVFGSRMRGKNNIPFSAVYFY